MFDDRPLWPPEMMSLPAPEVKAAPPVVLGPAAPARKLAPPAPVPASASAVSCPGAFLNSQQHDKTVSQISGDCFSLGSPFTVDAALNQLNPNAAIRLDPE